MFVQIKLSLSTSMFVCLSVCLFLVYLTFPLYMGFMPDTKNTYISWRIIVHDLAPQMPGSFFKFYIVAHVPPPTAQRTEDLIVYSISSCSSCQL